MTLLITDLLSPKWPPETVGFRVKGLGTEPLWEFPETLGSLILGPLILRILLFWGAILGFPIFGNPPPPWLPETVGFRLRV